MTAVRYPKPVILNGIPPAGHVILEASAGTGKTFALQNLVVDLLLTDPFPRIEELLVVTFTEAATWELRGRIRKQIETMLSVEPEAGTEHAWTIDRLARAKLEAALFEFDRASICTMHAFCNDLLRETAFDTGARFDLEVDDKTRIFHRALRAELREGISLDPGTRPLLKEWLESKSMESLESLLRTAHFQRVLPARALSATDNSDLEARVVDRFLARVVSRLERLKRDEGLLDYDDMIGQVAQALDGPRGPELAGALRSRFRCALIDEFQDTDDVQWKIFRTVFVEGAAGNRLFVIGDPKQAIYGFRGADVHTYLRARATLKEAGAFEAHLNVNYRSTPRMIDACNRILLTNGSSALLTGEIRYDREVTTGLPDLRALDEGGGDVPPVTILRYPPANGKAGAPHVRATIGRTIARSIRTMLDRGSLRRQNAAGTELVPPERIYILTRTTGEGYEVGGYLREAGVEHAYYKQDGLFETPEAFDTLDLLRALENPSDRALRLRAWGTPFFAVPWRDLMLCRDLPDDHPLVERLLSWSQIAEESDFVSLFDRVLHESGLVERELFLSDSERELTNYIHVLEILVEQAMARSLALPDMVSLLRSYTQGETHPLGEDGDVQRLERERAVVQIMTVHKCKGLEADVVFLFGGTGGRGRESPIAVYYTEDRKRRAAIGAKEKTAAKPDIERENAQEDQRLLYVALTRARLKLFLPYVPAEAMKREMKGYYRPLNDRLEALFLDTDGLGGLFEVRDVSYGESSEDAEAHVVNEIASWTPDPLLLSADPPAREFDALREAHAAANTWSYTSILRWREAGTRGGDSEEPAADPPLPETEATGDPPGGRLFGRFLHTAIEKLPFGGQSDWNDYEAWIASPEVAEAFAEATKRHGSEPDWIDRARRLAFDALQAPVALARGDCVEGLYRCANVRELEFLYPIPERHQPLLSSGGGEDWRIERGYLQGFVDLVFVHNDLTYFADWKTDLLPVYSREAMAERVRERYGIQALIYTIGVIRLLGIRNESEYEKRFGGLLYLFLRGMKPGGDGRDGVHYERPTWSEAKSYERALLDDSIIPGGRAA
jgi:exodeoxyribonuclease V beta subunit